ncbi:MAG TPA: cyclic peptide export ABC transporter [Polyangium sp.]|nr:cyclic peptide export ABC transporter [Polyangium sp.]
MKNHHFVAQTACMLLDIRVTSFVESSPYAARRMNLLELLKTEAGPRRNQIILAATLAGISNALILASVNAAAQSPENAGIPAFFMFALSITLHVVCVRHSSHETNRLVEAVLHRIKVRIGDRLARTEFDALERVKAAEICDRITENTAFISQTAGIVGSMMQSAVIMVFTGIYLASLSPAAAAIVALICAAGAMKFVEIRREFVLYTRETMAGRVTFLDRLTDLIAGFKEFQFGRRRRRDLREHIAHAAEAMRSASISASNLRSDGLYLGDAILFAVLAGIVYAQSLYFNADVKTMTAIVAAVMFLWGPFLNFMMGLMPYIRSNLALDEIATLEAKLEIAASQGPRRHDTEDPWHGQITSIEMRQLEYAYPSENGGKNFHIGPSSFHIDAREVLFIVGGNGSGKSTLLKVLTGLYAPTAGELLVNGIVVRPENVAWYRDMISAIFSDFHLFAKLYGLAGVEEEAVHRLITRMRLDGQTAFVNRTFTKLDLSTGQKKRIAMIVALLEARPICVFDEWAADQDPEFRKYFYEELLPVLRQEGKMVLVVSHDDRYFHHADRVLTMEYGNVRSIERPRLREVAG